MMGRDGASGRGTSKLEVASGMGVKCDFHVQYGRNVMWAWLSGESTRPNGDQATSAPAGRNAGLF